MDAIHGRSRVAIRQEAVRAFCQQQRVRELALFGSVLRDDFTDKSDIDVLIDFLPDTTVTLFTFADMQEALSRIFGRTVDLVVKESLHRRIKDDVLKAREVLYVAAQ